MAQKPPSEHRPFFGTVFYDSCRCSLPARSLSARREAGSWQEHPKENMTNSKERFNNKMRELLRDPRVRRMQAYRQHRYCNSLIHSIHVAKVSFAMAEHLHLKIDEEALAVGALLHDYYLYDIKGSGYSAFRHGTSHPQVSLENAMRDFPLTEKEQNMIRSHMWPLTLFHAPKSKEAWIVTMADKYCAIKEYSGRGKAYEQRKNGRE